MKVKSIIVSSILILFAASCGKMTEEEVIQSAKDKAEKGQFAEAIDDYENYLKEFPDGTRLAEIRFEIGKIYHSKMVKSLSDAEAIAKAIEYYKSVYELFPDSPEAPNAMFMVGFIQANELQQLDFARQTYNQFLEKYPNSELVDDANAELQNLGLDPEQILQKQLEKAE